MAGKMSLEKLKSLGKELAQDAALAKGEEEQRRRVEKFGSIEMEERLLGAEKEKSRGMER